MTHRKPAMVMQQLWLSRVKKLVSSASVIFLLAAQKVSGWISMILPDLRMPYGTGSIRVFNIFCSLQRVICKSIYSYQQEDPSNSSSDCNNVFVGNFLAASVNLEASTPSGDLLPGETEPDKIIYYLCGLVNNIALRYAPSRLNWNENVDQSLHLIFIHPLDLLILTQLTPNLVIS